MNYVSVCKNTIARNNKRKWIDPEPAIRVSKTRTGKAVGRYNEVAIVDAEGNKVGMLTATITGEPILKCGAKVVLRTEFDVVPNENV